LIAQVVFTILILWFINQQDSFYVPVDVPGRHSFRSVKLTEIGKFGLVRKARPSVPSHYHTGIDIRRPHANYVNEPIFPVARGVVISKKTNGPYAQLILEHHADGKIFWSLYEHIAGIIVNVHDTVDPEIPIARFMNREELQKNGWQFDHVHLEILKVCPIAMKPDEINPERYFAPYSLVCYTVSDLNKYYYDPVVFLTSQNERGEERLL
jgi:hypothetical protein